MIEMSKLNLQGSIIDNGWIENIRHENGKPYWVAILILSEIVYWYRPVEVRDEVTGKFLGWKKKYKADKLQKSHKALADRFGISKRQVKAALDYLRNKELIALELRNIYIGSKICNNVLFIELLVDNLKKITGVEREFIEEAVDNIPPPTIECTTPPTIECTTPPTIECMTNTKTTSTKTTSTKTTVEVEGNSSRVSSSATNPLDVFSSYTFNKEIEHKADILNTLQYFFKRYYEYTGKKHPVYKDITVKKIVNRLEDIFEHGIKDDEKNIKLPLENFEDFQPIVDKHFATEIVGMDHHLMGFIFGRNIVNRYYEVYMHYEKVADRDY